MQVQLPCRKEEAAAYVCEGSKVDLVLHALNPSDIQGRQLNESQKQSN